MTSDNNKRPRRQQILEALAHMLEASPGARITTAALAKEVGVSEAALYRHFPSKSKMLEGLIEFIEETLFSRVALLVADEQLTAVDKCAKTLYLLLTFAERNPGITRLLTGDALAGETERLRKRVAQLYDRLEAQMKQVLREAELREGLRFVMPIGATVSVWMATAEGRIAQFVRSDFSRPPSEGWQEQWPYLASGFVS